MQILEQVASAEGADGEKPALLYILLNNFREIRDSLDVTDSDMVLRDVTGVIQKNIGAQDSIARLGDYVFTIMHYGDEALTTREFAEAVLRSVEDHVYYKGKHAVQVSASIGVCQAGSHNLSAEGLIQRADLPVKSRGLWMTVRSTSIMSLSRTSCSRSMMRRRRRWSGRQSRSSVFTWCTRRSSAWAATSANATRCCCGCLASPVRSYCPASS